MNESQNEAKTQKVKTMTTTALTPRSNFSTVRPVARQTISLRQRRRLARSIFSLSLLVLIGAGFSAVSHASDSHSHAGTSGYVKIVIGNGQSLWSIASIINKNDPTSVVDEIVSTNGLSSTDLKPGESIWVPTK
jgi:hypothetical protein